MPKFRAIPSYLPIIWIFLSFRPSETFHLSNSHGTAIEFNGRENNRRTGLNVDTHPFLFPSEHYLWFCPSASLASSGPNGLGRRIGICRRVVVWHRASWTVNFCRWQLRIPSGTYKRGAALPFSTRIFSVPVLPSVCGSSSDCPPDHHRSLLSLTHRDNTHSHAFYPRRTTRQVTILTRPHFPIAL